MGSGHTNGPAIASMAARNLLQEFDPQGTLQLLIVRMWIVLRSLLIGGGLALAVSTTAFAQSADWNGNYIGTAIGEVTGRDADFDATVRSVYKSGISLGNGVTGTRDFSLEDDLPAQVSGSLYVGRRFEVGRLVVGVEAQVDVVEVSETFIVGPTTTYPAALGPDTLSAELAISHPVSIRARAGVPIGDRVLVSAFAGPVAAEAKMTVTQSGVRLDVTPDLRFSFIAVPYSTTGFTDSRILLGAVVGGTIDVRLSDDWSARAETGWSFYDSIEARSGLVPGSNGGASPLAYKPRLYAFSLGLTRRF